jgi:hypothetical protein
MMHKTKNLVLVLTVCLLSTSSVIGQLPKTDVYLATIKNIGTKPQMTSLSYLSGFNKDGYNNQAKLFAYDRIYVTSAIDTHKITDIYKIDLNDNELSQVTDTEQISEFSPTPSPIKDHFSVVRIEADGSTQTLWLYPDNQSNKGYRVLKKLGNIGYHCWINEDSVALFLTGTPHTLAIAQLSTGKTEVIADDIGRCLKYDGNENVYFVHKIQTNLWVLKSYHIITKNMNTICQMPSNREDFEILPNGSFIIGDGPTIKSFNPEKDSSWVVAFDLSDQNIMNINRVNIIRDRLVFINNK